MEAILKFNLDDPNDVMAHKRCVKALEMALLVRDDDDWDVTLNDGLEGL